MLRGAAALLVVLPRCTARCAEGAMECTIIGPDVEPNRDGHTPESKEEICFYYERLKKVTSFDVRLFTRDEICPLSPEKKRDKYV